MRCSGFKRNTVRASQARSGARDQIKKETEILAVGRKAHGNGARAKLVC
jgi:hypothetical protein